MSSTQSWTEYNGSGQTATANRADCNWKNVDDSTTTYSSSPINASANANSFPKYQALVFAGTWNSISAFTYKCSSNAPATGITLNGSVVTSYTTPATTATGDGALSTSGVSANLSATTPFAVGTASLTGGGTAYANCLRTQLATTSSASSGDIPTVTITASWTES